MASNIDLPEVPPLPVTQPDAAAMAPSAAAASATVERPQMQASSDSAPAVDQPEEETPRKARLSELISPDDLVPSQDMTGIQSPLRFLNTDPSRLRSTDFTNRPNLLNSPQRLRASAVVGNGRSDSKKETVEVVIQGVKPYIEQSPYNPAGWTSPRPVKPAIASTVTKTAGIPVRTTQPRISSVVHKFLAWQLAGLDVALATEIMKYADEARIERVRKAAAHDIESTRRSPSMQDAINLVELSRNREAHSATEAEEIVRKRIGKTGEHPLHVYGVLLHIAFYAFTILLAIGGYLHMALSASASVGIESLQNGKVQILPSWLHALSRCAQRILFTLCIIVMALPVAVCCVALCAVPDILLLLARPVLPLRIKLKLLPWFFPTSVAFFTAGLLGGYGFAFGAYLFLGACPVTDAFVSTSFGGQLCNTQDKTLPLSGAFQAAVVCAPHFMAHQKSLRANALRGIPQFYAPAGGKFAQMPFVVQWAFLLGDAEIRSAWEAECMGQLQLNLKSRLSPV